MTGLEKLVRANRWRIRAANLDAPSALASTDANGFNGNFLVPTSGELWWVSLNDTNGWKHLAISHSADKTIRPSWVVIDQIRDFFFADDEWVVQFFPPENVMLDYRLHLWVPLNDELPHPPILEQ